MVRINGPVKLGSVLLTILSVFCTAAKYHRTKRRSSNAKKITFYCNRAVAREAQGGRALQMDAAALPVRKTCLNSIFYFKVGRNDKKV